MQLLFFQMVIISGIIAKLFNWRKTLWRSLQKSYRALFLSQYKYVSFLKSSYYILLNTYLVRKSVKWTVCTYAFRSVDILIVVILISYFHNSCSYSYMYYIYCMQMMQKMFVKYHDFLFFFHPWTFWIPTFYLIM